MTMEIVYNCMLLGITDRERIVKKTGMSRRQVQAALSSLYRQGKLAVASVETIGRNKQYTYTVGQKPSIFSNVNSIFNVGVV